MLDTQVELDRFREDAEYYEAHENELLEQYH